MACSPELPPLPWAGAPPAIEHPALAEVDTWIYWLQGADLTALAETDADLVVIDYSRDGSEEAAYSPEAIAALQARGKLVIAYLSLGEAEDYRFYWEADGGDWERSPPSWLGPENPDWEGNYKVRYWDPSWEALIVSNPGDHPLIGDAPSWLDRILDTGFDGVFLDIVDAFQYWGPAAEGGTGERPAAASEMAGLLARLAQHAKERHPGFVICQQNASTLPSPWLEGPLSEAERAQLWESVDWISAEDVFFRGNREANNRYNPDPWMIEYLDVYRQQGKLVTAIDYFDPEQPKYREQDMIRFFALSSARGWVGGTGPRALDRLPAVYEP